MIGGGAFTSRAGQANADVACEHGEIVGETFGGGLQHDPQDIADGLGTVVRAGAYRGSGQVIT